MDARPAGTVGGAGAVVTATPNFKLRDQFDSAICRVCHRLVDRLWVAIAADRSEQVVCCDACAQPTERDAAIKRAEQRERELRRNRRQRWESGEAPIRGSRRRADVVFPRARVAVYVDGCYWHGCPEHGTWPKANAAWWREKIEANVRRDRDTDEQLRQAGWTSMRVWGHEEVGKAADRVEREVRRRS